MCEEKRPGKVSEIHWTNGVRMLNISNIEFIVWKYQTFLRMQWNFKVKSRKAVGLFTYTAFKIDQYGSRRHSYVTAEKLVTSGGKQARSHRGTKMSCAFECQNRNAKRDGLHFWSYIYGCKTSCKPLNGPTELMKPVMISLLSKHEFDVNYMQIISLTVKALSNI